MSTTFASSVATRGERTATLSAVALVIACAGWLGFSAGLRPLMLPDEGRYVGVAWEMLNSGNWLLPTLDGFPFFHKPPLFYWLTGLSLKVFGVSEWAARAASVLAASAVAGGLYVFLRRHAPDHRLAPLAVGILVTQPLFFGGAQFANLDMLVAAMIALTVLLAADAAHKVQRGLSHWRSLTAAYGFAVLGVLAKGLIGVVLPAIIIVGWLLVRRQLRQLRALLPVRLILLLLLASTPWFWLMEESYSGFLDYFFLHHHFQRFAETGFNNPKPFWFLVPMLLVGAFPWSPWIVRTFSASFWQDRARFDVRALMVVWVSVVVVFFSLPSSKLVGYILPALPALAYLLADGFLAWLDQRSAASSRAHVQVAFVGAAVVCVALVLLVAYRGSPSLRERVVEAAPAFQVDDQLVMLDEYPYDLPFHLKAKKSPWVVSDWGRPDLADKDNWRRELVEAARFDPGGRQERLLFPSELTPRACAQAVNALWIWGKQGFAARFPFLTAEAAVLSLDHNTLWRVSPDALRQLADCREKPRSG